MRSEYSRLFVLLDNYARAMFGCFLAELDLTRDRNAYTVCFRPTGGSKDSANRYACRYLEIDIEEARCAVQIGSLPLAVTEQLALELRALGKLV
jgi:hypothetical protein